MSKKNCPKILVFDIETAGVQGLSADRGFVVCFGYKWLGEKSTHCLTIADFPGRNVHDDTQLLKRAIEVLEKADGSVAHFGAKFDKPYLQARLLQADLDHIPDNKLTDTCLLARTHLRLSSNRLGNLAAFLHVDTQKMDKRGGWPDWWMGALRGDKKSISLMATYCKQDVQCLEEVFLRMRHIIPTRFLPVNMAIGAALWTCPSCGGHRSISKGYSWSDKKCWQRRQCMGCGKYVHLAKAIASTPAI